MQTQATGAGLPVGARAMFAQAGQLFPILTTVGGAEQRGVFDAGINSVRVLQRRLEMPDPLELPGAGCAVVPLVGPRHALVFELVANGCPRLTTVVRALDQLAEPARGL